MTGRYWGSKQKLRAGVACAAQLPVIGYVAPPGECYYNTLLRWDAFFIIECGIMHCLWAVHEFEVRASFSSPGLPLCQISFLLRPSFAELAHGERLHTQSLTHLSHTQSLSLFDALGTEAFTSGKKHQYGITSYGTHSKSLLGWEGSIGNNLTTRCLALTSSGSVVECGRLSQPSWYLVTL